MQKYHKNHNIITTATTFLSKFSFLQTNPPPYTRPFSLFPHFPFPLSPVFLLLSSLCILHLISYSLSTFIVLIACFLPLSLFLSPCLLPLSLFLSPCFLPLSLFLSPCLPPPSLFLPFFILHIEYPISISFGDTVITRKLWKRKSTFKLKLRL